MNIHTPTPTMRAEATGQKYPVYRHMQGLIQCQIHKGGDWQPLDFVWANILLARLDGVELHNCELVKRDLIPAGPGTIFHHPV